MKIKFKRIIGTISAVAMLVTSSLTASVSAASGGTHFPFPLSGYVDQNITTACTFTVEGAENVVYSFTFDSVGWADAKVRSNEGSDGNRSLRIRGTGTTSRSEGLGAEFTLKFGDPTEDGQYVISFDLYREQSSAYDYVALNYDGWDEGARLTGTTTWTATELGAGNSIGGAGTGTWGRYTATLSTDADDPQLNFAVADGGELHIDNIIVKDTSGKTLFAESFESTGPIIAVPGEEEPDEPEIPDEPDEPDEPEVGGETRFPFPLEDYVDQNITAASTYTVEGAENVVYSFTFENIGSPDAKVRTLDASDGTRSLRIRGSYTHSTSKGLGAEFTLKFGNPTADGRYDISFDLYREQSSAYDYATLNYDGWSGAARLTGTTQWTVTELGTGNGIGGTGTGSWSRYTATLSTTADDPQLNFAVANGGELHIDNIIIKDTSGNVIFAESFEAEGLIIGEAAEPDEPVEPDEPDEPIEPDEPDEPDEPGDSEVTDIIFPFEQYLNVNYIPDGNYVVEGAENVVYIVKRHSSGSPDVKLRSGDGSDGTRSLRIRGTNTDSTDKGLGVEFTTKIGNPTADGQYVISFDLYREQSSAFDYAAFNYDGWDGAARLTGTTMWTVTELGFGRDIGGTGTGRWSRYTATLSTDADDPQLNFAVANGGELHIDNIIVKDTSGNVIFEESFEGYYGEEYEYLGYGLYADDELTESIEGSTTYTAKVSIVNNRVTEGIKAQIFAILRKDGEMVNISASDLVTVRADRTNKEGTEVSTTITVGDVSDGSYEISVYFWDGLGTMKVLQPSKQYKECE